MSPEEDRRISINNFLETVYCISNKDYQSRVWINALGPECDDFIETTIFFNDYCRKILAKHKDYNLSERQYRKVLGFKKIYDEFADNHYSEEDFIDSPEWNFVMTEAKKVLEEFRYPFSR